MKKGISVLGAMMAQFFASGAGGSLPSKNKNRDDGKLNYIVGDVLDVKKVKVSKGNSYQKKQRSRKLRRKGV